MTLDQHQRVTKILAQVLDVNPAERRAFLLEACVGDDLVRREVESLLEQESKDVSVLNEPIVSLRTLAPKPRLGERSASRAVLSCVGPYQIERELGHGGMGTVYLAVREGDFHKRVALKLIRSDLASREIVRRFERERQLLANLEHPNIARILDGGATPEGLPYFVMEYVEGEPIDAHCQRIGVRRRLKLFRKVCSAVQAAHANLVVHRDLKPGNILVTAEGEPKLLDFGIAKVLTPETTGETLATARGLGPMTLFYASPEQICGGRITTASDVYALGVLLFKLLTGTYPYSLDSSKPIQTARSICDEEPRKPSSAIRFGDTATKSARPHDLHRNAQFMRLKHRLSGDLDSIVLKALRKEPRERYGSVEQLSEDLRRQLDGLPVLARKGTFIYRTGKLIRRNKLALAALLMIFGSSIATTLLWRRAVAANEVAISAQEEAEQQRDRVASVADFLKSVFREYDPDLALGESPTTLEVLARGKALIEELDDSTLQAEIQGTLGTVYRDRGLYADARALFERSVRLLRTLHSGDHPDLAKAINNLAGLLYRLGKYQEAEVLYAETLAMRHRLGQQGVDVAKAMCNQGTILMNRGAYQPAEELYLDCLRIREEAYGPTSLDVAMSRRSLGALYYTQSDMGKAEPYFRDAHDIHRELLEPGHTRLALTLSSLGRLRLAQGKIDEAERLLTQALEIRLERYGENHPNVALTRKDMAELLLVKHEDESAEILLKGALETLRRSKPEGAWEIADGESLLGGYLITLRRYQEAELYLIDSYQTLQKIRGGGAIYTHRALMRIVDLYSAWGKPEQAAKYRGLLEKSSVQSPRATNKR